tara:strand:- start:312 stop:443 length:132 start_codon:yes stop_codon:yes gene_type:complete
MICCVVWDVISCFLYGKRVKETVEKDCSREKDDKGRRYKVDKM